jgi:hypothetical protein
MAVFINPGANDGSTDDRSMLLEMYVQGTNLPMQAEPVFDNTNIAGITNIPAEPGGSYRHRFDAGTPAPLTLAKGDVMNGQVSGQFYKTITREADDLLYQAHTLHESDSRRVEWAAQTIANVGRQHRYNMGILKSRRVVRALSLAARAASKTITVSGVPLWAHNQGTVVSQGGGSATLATAVSAAVGIGSSTSRENSFRCLELLRLTLDQKNAPNGPGQRLAIADSEFMAGLQAYGNERAFTTDNIILSNGNLQRKAVYLPAFDLTILATVNRYTGDESTLPSNGNYGAGVLPATNVIDGPSALRANFNPTSTTGFPVLLGMVATNGGKGAIHVTEEKPMMAVYDKHELGLSETFALVGQWTIAPLNPECAFALEITSNSTSTRTAV